MVDAVKPRGGVTTQKGKSRRVVTSKKRSVSSSRRHFSLAPTRFRYSSFPSHHRWHTDNHWNCQGEGRQTSIHFARRRDRFLHHAPADQVLELFVHSQSKHFFAAAHRFAIWEFTHRSKRRTQTPCCRRKPRSSPRSTHQDTVERSQLQEFVPSVEVPPFFAVVGRIATSVES